ncbi:MAG: hypothetical protein LN415_08260 [Candidatus Thermoplasmatota archaeon]|nr:hypothetical protein [Candidatus Thermoplasmatota archaeon]
MTKTADVEMVSIPRPLYESLLETLEVLSDKSEIESIRRGIQDIRKKRVHTEEDFLEMYEDLV